MKREWFKKLNDQRDMIGPRATKKLEKLPMRCLQGQGRPPIATSPQIADPAETTPNQAAFAPMEDDVAVSKALAL